jgi:hypothetical protein
MLFISEWLDEYTNMALLKDKIDTESVPARFHIIKEYAPGVSCASIIDTLNAGVGIVNHAGHGNITSLSVGDCSLFKDDMESLVNGPRYTVFYTLACEAGDFSSVVGCFGRSFMLSPVGGGFFVGNTRVGWYHGGEPLVSPSALFDREFFKAIFQRGHAQLGVAHADAKAQRVPWSAGGANRWLQYSLNLMGDPEIPIWTDSVKTMTVVHRDTMSCNPNFTVTVTDSSGPVGGARVCLWKQDDLYLVDETDGAGTCDFTVTPSDTGEILVTVTKENYLPYMGSAYEDKAGLDFRVDIPPAPKISVHPNPVVGAASIRYTLRPASGVKIKAGPAISVYDISGRLIRRFGLGGNDGLQGTVMWDGLLEEGIAASPGIYIAEIRHGTSTAKAKLVMLR